jgi:C1A family cysteine protease
MQKTIALCLFLASVLAIPTSHLTASSLQTLFESWKLEHGKVYATEAENQKRFEIFSANSKIIEQHNSEKHSWTMGFTKFVDLTPKEFEALQTLWPRQAKSAHVHKRTGLDIPTIVDWRTQGIVVPVKDQGSCGSCWAFSTVVSYEGQVARKTGNLTSFSEQNLVDCVKDQTISGSAQTCCSGCEGGLMDYAFEYMIEKQQGNDATEDRYPYTATDGVCSFNIRNTAYVPVTHYTDVESGNEEDLKDATANVGPISIAVDANSGWQTYTGGVFAPKFCNPNHLNHGVAIVGYGVENNIQYWIVRNSWGDSWGEEGYIRIAYGSNICGLANEPCYPTV